MRFGPGMGVAPAACRCDGAPVPPPYVGPLDFRPGAVGVGGTILFYTSYTGKALRVRNPDTAAEGDISFGSDGRLVEAEITAALGASSYLTVTTLYRQDGGSNHYIMATAAQQPRLAKIDNEWTLQFESHDGAGATALRATLALAQPFTRYMIMRPRAWTALQYYADGISGGQPDGAVFYQSGSSPGARIYAGGLVGPTDFPLNVRSIATNVFNGASSAIRRNKLPAVTGNAGSANITAQSIGARANHATGAASYILGVFNFAAADDTTAQNAVIDSLAAELGISL